MEIKVKPQVIKTETTWRSKIHGVVFVNDEKNIDTVLKYLVKQDEYWKHGGRELIKVAPVEIDSYGEIYRYCQYVGKKDIYDVEKMITDLKNKGIDVMVFQYVNDED